MEGVSREVEVGEPLGLMLEGGGLEEGPRPRLDPRRPLGEGVEIEDGLRWPREKGVLPAFLRFILRWGVWC